MQPTSSSESNIRPFPIHRAYQRVEFQNVEHFLEEMLDENMTVVRMDLISEVQPTELSFVHYVSLSVSVTAQNQNGFVLYEYLEPIATVAATDGQFCDEVSQQAGEHRLTDLRNLFSNHGIEVRRGKFTLPIIVQGNV